MIRIQRVAKVLVMEIMIFSGYGMFITEENGKYYINFDEGGISIKDIRYEISEQEAIKARQSGLDAYEVMLRSQSRARKCNL
ncbi:UNVERIFIED_ORG: hypothetical protein C7430_11110 [Pantoea agglomerans]|uniref:Uncharacterized protein n=2 Tax=Enterobacter agglomerans TaxID=549 RepID=A0ABD6XLK0_ENTAG